MAIDLNFSNAEIRSILRGDGSSRVPRPYPFTAVMSVIYDSVVTATSHGLIAIGPNEAEGWGGGSPNYWLFYLANDAGHQYVISEGGNDYLSGVNAITGRWTRNAVRVAGVGSNQMSWWWDLPDLNAVRHASLSSAITLTSGAQIMVGSSPWTTNEMIDGGVDGLKMWQYALPLWAILIESQYREPVLPQFFPYLWSAPDLRAPRYSGTTKIYYDAAKGKNFTPNPNYPTIDSRPGPSYLKTWKGRESLEDLLRSVARGAGGFTLTAGAGSYALTGTALGLLLARALVGDAGSYALLGANASLLFGREIAAGSGSYIVTGTDATLIYSGSGNKTLAADPGVYTITGTSASLLLNRLLSAGAGVYSVSGQTVDLLRHYLLTADGGTYVVNGDAANFLRTFLLDASAGVYTIQGQTVELVYSGAPTPSGDFLIFLRRRRRD